MLLLSHTKNVVLFVKLFFILKIGILHTHDNKHIKYNLFYNHPTVIKNGLHPQQLQQ